MAENNRRRISTMNERPLHAAIKRWYSRPHDRFEVPIDGFVIDLVQGDTLVEIQTRNFSAIKRKLQKLTCHHHVRLVYPVAYEKWIIKLAQDGESQLGRRKSPKKGSVEQVFVELVCFPELMSHPNFSLHVLLIQEEEVLRYEGRRRWRRRGWALHERRLLKVLTTQLFESPAEMADMIPSDLDEPFTTLELANAIKRPRWLAQKMAYCLREMDTILPAGKRRNAILYTRAAT